MGQGRKEGNTVGGTRREDDKRTWFTSGPCVAVGVGSEVKPRGGGGGGRKDDAA